MPRGADIALYSMNHVETRVDANGEVSSSQERIVQVTGPSRAGTFDADDEAERERNGKGGGISKTVEFEFHESAV